MVNIFTFLKPYRMSMSIALFLMFVELAVELLQPLFIARIIDDGIMKRDLSVVITWGAVMVGISILAFIAGITNSFFAGHASQGFAFDVRKSLFEKVQAFSFANLGQFPASSLITRITNDVTQMQNTLFMSLRIMLRAPLFVVGGIVMALFVNWKLALVLVAVTPLLVIFLIWMMRQGRTLFRSVQGKLDAVNSVMKENLSGIRLIKAFFRREHEEQRFIKVNEGLMDETVSALRLMEMIMPVLLLVMNVSIIALLWFGSNQVNTGGAKIGEVVAIVNYTTRITGVLSMFAFIITAFSRAKASAERVVEVLHTEVDILDVDEESVDSPITKGNIEFQDVSFRYPDSRDNVLQDISFTARPGEMVALLGATGSGKSSLFQLIPRLYDVTNGAIFIDGHDVRDIMLTRLRSAIGFVSQEAMLFTGTVRDNIAWGNEGASTDEIEQAARDAQIHDTICELPNGYDTLLGQKGVNLSGGQKQRLSIARALVRKPGILLLDDSTSALDLKTEARLLHALKAYHCTTLIITQKISTACEADMILLLEDGTLSAKGTHEELLEASRLYRNIYESQFGKGEAKRA